jgi:P-type Ca2+ transporter type 2C
MNDFLSRNPIRSLIPGILLSSLLLLGFMVLREFLLTLAWALIITYVMWPPYQWLRHLLKDKATLSAAVMTTLIATVISLSAFWLAAMLQEEIKIAYQTLADNLTQEAYQLPDFIRRIPWLGSTAQEWIARLTSDRAELAAQLADWVKQGMGGFARFLGGIGQNVLKLGVILVTVFFCFRDGKEITRQLHQGLVRFLGKYQDVYLQAAGNTTRAVVYGLVLAALGQGVIAGIGYFVAGVKAPVLFGAITALLALVPMGATLVWMPIGIMLVLMDQFWQGVGLLLWGFLVVSTVDNVIRPIVISGASQVPFLVVMFGVLGGLTTFGGIGLFLGPVILAVLLSVWQAWLKQQGQDKEAPGLDDSTHVPTETTSPQIPDQNWHALSTEAVLSTLDADENQGLTDDEIVRRRALYGSNRLPESKPRSAFMRFIVQFHNLLLYVLIGTASITAILGHWTDTGVILAVVLLNAVFGFIQEGKAENALWAIRQMLSAQAMVQRDGRRITVPAEELVPGDIVLLQPGDKVPADMRLLKVKNLQIQEAVLTGESVPVEKSAEAVASDAVLSDRLGMAYSGTLVTTGQASGLVVATGAQTEIGHISTLVSQVHTLTTPLLRQMAVFARWVTAAVLLLSIFMFTFGVWVRDFSAMDMFMIVVGMAVAAIPEGLPAILSVTLAIGVQRLATRKAIIRRLPAVETLGSVSVICTDKTGTLTRNEMTVRSLVTADQVLEVTGTGYDPHGDFLHDGLGVAVEPTSIPQQVLRAGLFCNDAALEQGEEEWRIHGDPMEAALLIAAMKAGLNADEEGRNYPRTDLIPFDSEHRFMATMHHSHTGEALIFVKGAPERLLEMCVQQRAAAGDQAINRHYWQKQIELLARQGQRVLAVACKPAPSHNQELNFEDLNDDLVLLGLFGLIDPPRTEAIAAIKECQSAGIRVKMITGDHALTACSIAAQLNLVNSSEVITGHEMELMNDDELRGRVQETDVYARVSPEHKLRLVSLLQTDGVCVAMTGDGVNDAPALRRADIGIAMGHKGTEAAKEASVMVITDDNFATIVHAVKEGRAVYENLKKAVAFLLPVNGGESISIIVAILLGYTLPITPLQILWVNMVSSIALAMTLAFEPGEPDSMTHPPRPANEPILSGFLVWRILLVTALFAAGIFGIFKLSLYQGSTLEEACTYAVNTLVTMEVFYLFSVRYQRVSSLSFKRLFNSPAVLIGVTAVIILQLVFTYAPFMEAFFDSRPVDLVHGMEIIAIGVGMFGILELEKLFRRKVLVK